MRPINEAIAPILKAEAKARQAAAGSADRGAVQKPRRWWQFAGKGEGPEPADKANRRLYRHRGAERSVRLTRLRACIGRS